MKTRQRLSETLDSLRRRGFVAGEVFVKTGRSRRFAIGVGGRYSGTREEIGWALRATAARASLFLAGTGLPDPDMALPEPDGRPLQLPPREEILPWNPPVDLGQALMSETESLALLDSVEKALIEELSDARVIRASMEEGTSESWIASSLGVDTGFRSRAASLVVEAAGPWRGESSAAVAYAARTPREFQPIAIARRLANRLVLDHARTAPAHERGEILVAAPVAARILCSLMPLWLGRQGEELARSLQDSAGRIGSPLLHVVDDGRRTGGVLESPVDGEGRPAGPVPLVEEGRFVQSLRDWRDFGSHPNSRYGSTRRNSWRDLPETGPSHLYIQPEAGSSVADLLGAISRGHYLVEPLGAGVFDFAKDRFRLPVCGFVLQRGQPSTPMSKVWLEGGIGALLRGIRGVARDLTFAPLGAMIGAPSLLLSGVGLRGESQGPRP